MLLRKEREGGGGWMGWGGVGGWRGFRKRKKINTGHGNLTQETRWMLGISNFLQDSTMVSALSVGQKKGWGRASLVHRTPGPIREFSHKEAWKIVVFLFLFFFLPFSHVLGAISLFFFLLHCSLKPCSSWTCFTVIYMTSLINLQCSFFKITVLTWMGWNTCTCHFYT